MSAIKHRTLKTLNRLIFLHVDNYRCLSNADFLLDPSYDVRYKNRHLSIAKRSDFPNDFYDIATKANVVTGLSAIIGMNGAGKTTVASLFRELSDGVGTEAKGVVLLSLEDGHIVCRTDIPYVDIDSRLRVRKNVFGRYSLRSHKDIYYLYHNPHAASDSPFLADGLMNVLYGRDPALLNTRFIDISSSGLIGKCAAESRVAIDVGEVPSTATDIYRERESASFFRTLIAVNKLRKDKSEKLDCLSLPNVNGVVIRANKSVVNSINTSMAGRGANAKELGMWKFLTLYDDADYFVQIFIAYVASYVKDLDDDRAGVVDAYFSYREALLSFCSKSITHASIGSKKSQSALHWIILKFLHDKCRLLPAADQHANQIVDFFECLERLLDEIHQDDVEIVLPLTDDDHATSLSSLMNKYYAINKSVDFVTFLPEPMLSAGEMAYMSVFSRIYPVLTDWAFNPRFDPALYSIGINPSRDPRHVVLFMDEVETALHPELQRKIVRNMMLFLELIGKKNLTVQLIFASHSPILLSDIPSQAVTVLRDGESVTTDTTSKETFASNIFDLYRLAFDLGEGTFGSFATEKIDKLLRKKARGTKFSQNDFKTAKMIGDRYFRNYLLGSNK